MTDATSADDLLTDTTPVTKVEGTAIDPAAHADPAAANLDPAKVKPPKPAKAPKRRRASTATRRLKRTKAAIAADSKAVAKDAKVIATLDHSDAAREEGRLAYQSAVSHEVGNFAELPEGASLDLRLADGGEFVDGALIGICADIQQAPQGVTYAKDVDIGPEGPPVRVSEAWLIASSGEAVRCAVGPLSGGGGYHAKIPAGHLKF